MAWKTVEFGSFLKERGDRFKPEEANTLDLKRIKKIDFQGKIHVIDHKPTKTNMIFVKKGDLVISGINVEKGALAVYEEDEDALATIHYSSYEYDKNQVDIEYLKWFFKSRTFQDIVKEQAGGGIKTELKAKKFLPLKIQLPGLDEQIDIARKIDNVAAEIDNLSETNNHNQTLLIQLRQAILQEAVKGKLVPQDPNDKPASELLKRIKTEKEKLIAEGKIKKQKPLPPITEEEISYELPQKWEWVRLGSVAEINMGQSPPGNSYNDKGKGVPLINGPVEFSKGAFGQSIKSKFTTAPTKMCKKGNLLLCVRGSTTGRTNIADFDACIGRGVAAIHSYLNQNYMNWFIVYSRELIYSKGSGSTFPNIPYQKLAGLLVSLPPLAEQKRIVAKVDQLVHLCNELETRLKQSKKDSEMLMQAVLHEAFS